MENLEEYMEVFESEATEHLENINNRLLELEQNPDDVEILNEIFRSAHTLKGMAATMGFNDIAELTHKMENLLDKLRKQELTVNPDIIDLLLKCSDSLEVMIESAINQEESGVDIEPLINELLAAMEGGKTEGEAKSEEGAEDKGKKESSHINYTHYDKLVYQEAKEKGMNLYEIHITFKEDVLMKSVRVFMIFQILENYGEIVKSEPEASELEAENFDLDFYVVLVSKAGAEVIQSEISKVLDVEKVEVRTLTEADFAQAPAEEQEEKKVVEKKPEKQPAISKEEKGKSQKEEEHKKKKTVIKTIRIETEKLDNLMNLVGELVINKTRLEELAMHYRLQDLLETIEQVGRITTDLQNVVMQARMMPIEHVFNRFPRMVRDFSRKLNKKIKLEMKGEKTELDKTVIDEIGDPLVHLVRNAIDHGIEPPEERVKAGKPEEGTVVLSAYHEGNNVFIEVKDDGRGIDPEKIRKKAIERGIITPEEAETMSEKEIINLIFLPGFSTAEKITDLSGRGVGMDVVKSKIEALSGSVEIESVLGKGTTVIVKLPLTLAIISALLVKVGEEIYAIPVGYVSQIIKTRKEEIKVVRGEEVIVLRNNVLPLVYLRETLKIPGEEFKDENIVVVKSGKKSKGLVVDRSLGKREIVVKSLGKMLVDTPYIAGATILGDGTVALIVDVAKLIA